MQLARSWSQTPLDAGHNWALILAGGEGTRLQSLTTTESGIAIPKQFCSFGGDGSLLHDSLRRARSVARPERTCVIVAEQHRRWWQALPLGIPASNVITQPHNRGTAPGILLPLLHILHRDPEAALLVLPSDHYVRDEQVLAGSLRRAMEELQKDRDHIVLLGITPEEPDPELGYILADADSRDPVGVVRAFVEKPDAETARGLMARGGVWNSFIFAASGQTLLRAFQARCPDLAGEMQLAVGAANEATRSERLAQLYERMPMVDFSRDILQRAPDLLRVMTVPQCGWSDLGTPRRVAEAMSKVRPQGNAVKSGSAAAFLDLTRAALAHAESHVRRASHWSGWLPASE